MPTFLTDAMLLGNSPLRWFLALLVGAGVWYVLHRLRADLRERSARRADRRRLRADDLLITVLGGTQPWTAVIAALWAMSFLLQFDPGTSLRLRQVLMIAMFIQVALWGNASVTFLVDRYSERSDMDGGRRTSLTVITFISRAVLYALLILIGLDTLGINITALVAGLGIGSVAVALAVQGILSDLFASMSIVFDKPFELGDYIVVDDLSGTVEHIGLRTTRVRSLSGEQLIFANNDLLTSRVRNYKRMATRRVAFTVHVELDTPVEKLALVPQLITGCFDGLRATRFDRSHFKAVGRESLEFETVYYVLSSDYTLYMDIQQKLNLDMLTLFAEHGISLGLPPRLVTVRGSPQAGGPGVEA